MNYPAMNAADMRRPVLNHPDCRCQFHHLLSNPVLADIAGGMGVWDNLRPSHQFIEPVKIGLGLGLPLQNVMQTNLDTLPLTPLTLPGPQIGYIDVAICLGV